MLRNDKTNALNVLGTCCYLVNAVFDGKPDANLLFMARRGGDGVVTAGASW